MELEKNRSRESVEIIEANREELNSFLLILQELPLDKDINIKKTFKKPKINPEFENIISYTMLDIPLGPILENNLIISRIDSFIGRSFEITSTPVADFQAIPDNQHKRIFSSSTGLSVSLGAVLSGLTIDRASIVGEGEVARVDFTPNGRASFDPKQMTDSLTMGIQGIRELVEAIGKGQLKDIQTLVGTTNINMALIAQRLGFAIVDQDRTPDGSIDATKGSFTVVARVEDVRARIREFEESGAVDRLQNRQKKQSVRAN